MRSLWKGLTPFAVHLTLKYALRMGPNASYQSLLRDQATIFSTLQYNAIKILYNSSFNNANILLRFKDGARGTLWASMVASVGGVGHDV